MKYIPNSVSRKIARQLLVSRKYAPRTLFVLGIAGTLTSTVLASRATLKLEPVLTKLEDNVKAVAGTATDTLSYRRQMVYVYTRGAGDILRLYAPAIAIGSLSIAALTGSHVTLTRRNASLTAAYAAMSTAFEEYRERVREELNDDEKELELYRGIRTETIKHKDGTEEVVKSLDPNQVSVYAKFFDEYNANWKKDADLNRIFVQLQQNYANDILQARGHIFLNEVYDMLGIDRTKAGQMVGWILTSDGDNYVDFGLFNPNKAAFIGGWERSVLLDFNVDGNILDLL